MLTVLSLGYYLKKSYTCIAEGHWKGDTVVGKSTTKTRLFDITERIYNLKLIYKLMGKTQDRVAAVLDKSHQKPGNRILEKKKSITLGNGYENLDMAGIEKSLLTKRLRTTIHFRTRTAPVKGAATRWETA